MIRKIEISDELYEKLRDITNIFGELIRATDSKTESYRKIEGINITGDEDEIGLLQAKIETLDELIEKADSENKTEYKIELLEKKIKTADELLEKLELVKSRLRQSQPPNYSMIEPISGNIESFEPIMQITNRQISKKLPNGTIIRGRFKEKNYETKINSSKYKYDTLNSIYIEEFNASRNIWRENIYFKDESGWHPLRTLK